MFRPKPEKVAMKASKKKGKRLGELLKSDEKTRLAEAAEMIDQFGYDPLVVNARGQMGHAPIFTAVRYNHPECAIKLALTSGLDGSHRTSEKETILVYALQYNVNHEFIQLLLKRTDIDISAQDSYGSSALLIACGDKQFTAYLPQLLERTDSRILYDFGRSRTSYHATPLIEMVCMVSYPTADVDQALLLKCITDFLNMPFSLDKKKLKARQEVLNYALLNAARGGCDAVVKLLLDVGASAECKNKDGYNAEQLAKYNDHPDTAALIANHNLPQPSAPPPEYNAPPRMFQHHNNASAPPLEDASKKRLI
tara:strand:+ start:971 stop:1900 length:930 start_codon:yes stop_codon:yes gene_type:complete